MRILIIVLLLLPLHLFSASKTEKSLAYNQGLEAYKSKDFQTSYTLFKKIYLKHLGDVNFNFYLGRSAYEIGNYEVALAAFERVGMMDESSVRNKLETARTYFMLKMYEDAEISYRDVLENSNISEQVRTNIQTSLTQVSKVQKKSFTYANVMLDYLYDSNVNYGSIGDYRFGGATLGRISELSDYALQAFAGVTNIYDIGYKNGFALKNTFTFYLKNYNKYDQFNVLFTSYTPSIIYKETSFTAELIAGFDRMELDQELYLSSFSFMPRYEQNHSPTLKSTLHVKYQRKKFAKTTHRDLDAHRYELGYALQNILTPRSYLQGSFSVIMERKERGTNLYVDFHEYKLNVSYANQFAKNYTFDFYSEGRSKNYKDHSNGFGSVRKDLSLVGSLGISMILNKTARFRLSNSFEYVNSNQDRFSYQKRITSLGYNKAF